MAQAPGAINVTAPARQALQIFDAHHPPADELINQCVHCGFCLSTCPTYRLWGEEADSPRGRIYLMELGLKEEVAFNQDYVDHFDRCLGCMACLTSCPSGVQYDKLIEATRAQIQRRFGRRLSERLFRRMIFAIFPYPDRLRWLLFPLWIYQQSGLGNLVRRSGVLSWLPSRLRAMESLLPEVSLRAIKGSAAPAPRPTGTPRLRVGMLVGCVQSVFFDAVNQASARVLAAEGCEVIVAPNQGCCGALMTHAGEEGLAVRFARRTIEAFDACKVDGIAINAAGCGSAMKEYGHLLRDDPRYAARAAAFSARCRDISEILAGFAPRAVRHPLPIRVAYHDACHLQHAQGITAEPRQLLKSIPGLELLEIADPAICCGSAGIYNLLEPEAARQLGNQKAQNVLSSGAEMVVSGNPGCTLQLQSCLKAAGRSLPVLHWIELLDASIKGATK